MDLGVEEPVAAVAGAAEGAKAHCGAPGAAPKSRGSALGGERSSSGDNGRGSKSEAGRNGEAPAVIKRSS